MWKAPACHLKKTRITTNFPLIIKFSIINYQLSIEFLQKIHYLCRRKETYTLYIYTKMGKKDYQKPAMMVVNLHLAGMLMQSGQAGLQNYTTHTYQEEVKAESSHGVWDEEW